MLIHFGEGNPNASKSRKLKCLTHTVGLVKVWMLSAIWSCSHGGTLYISSVLWSTLNWYPFTGPSFDMSLIKDWLPTYTIWSAMKWNVFFMCTFAILLNMRSLVLITVTLPPVCLILSGKSSWNKNNNVDDDLISAFWDTFYTSIVFLLFLIGTFSRLIQPASAYSLMVNLCAFVSFVLIPSEINKYY